MTGVQQLMDNQGSDLRTAARRAAERAYAPYSGFKVGAALVTETGHCHVGANVENASYGLTICAERVALFAAVIGEGFPARVQRMVIVGPNSSNCAPCGACRQVLAELAPDAEISFQQHGGWVTYSAADLLPMAFSPSDLTT
jgi:cytidine deaminase